MFKIKQDSLNINDFMAQNVTFILLNDTDIGLISLSLSYFLFNHYVKLTVK